LQSLKAKTNIKNPATFDMWSMLLFLNSKNVCPWEIDRQIVEAYSESVTKVI